MVMKCYNKPNRKKPRKFTTCDAVRIAKKAAQNHGRSEVTASVAFGLGYPRVIDGSKLTEEELKRRIEQVLKVSGTLEDILSQIPVFSRLGITIRIITKFAGSFAFLAAGVAIYVIEQETIIGAKSCGK